MQDMWLILGATYMYAMMVTKRVFYDCTFCLWNCNLLDSIYLVLSQKHYQKQFLIMKSFFLFFPVAVESRQTCCHNRTVLEKILTFGRELQNMSIQLRREHGKNETNKKALQVSIYAGDV